MPVLQFTLLGSWCFGWIGIPDDNPREPPGRVPFDADVPPALFRHINGQPDVSLTEHVMPLQRQWIASAPVGDPPKGDKIHGVA